MCGIFGLISNNIQASDVEKLEFLGLLSATRGLDSTGVMKVTSGYNGKTNFDYLKLADDVLKYFSLKDWRPFKNQHSIKAFVGHTRSATIGSIVVKNAHPFMSKPQNVMGVHNGTLRGTYEGEKEFGTDSEALINLLDKVGPTALATVKGAFATIWFDKRANKLFIARNDERPLHIATTVSGDTFYASEKWMLEALALKFGTKWKEEPKSLEPFVLYSYFINNGSVVMNRAEATVEGWEAPKVNTTVTRGNFFQGETAVRDPLYYDKFDWSQYSDPELWEDDCNRAIENANDKLIRGTGVDRTIGRTLVQQSQDTRGEAAEEAGKEKVKTAVEVNPSCNSLPWKPGNGSTSVVPFRREPVKGPNALFINGLREPQRLSPTDGTLEVMTVNGHWMPWLKFANLIRTQECEWLAKKVKEVSGIRHWFDKDKFVCDEAYQNADCKNYIDEVMTFKRVLPPDNEPIILN